jgi:hypothetical protein
MNPCEIIHDKNSKIYHTKSKRKQLICWGLFNCKNDLNFSRALKSLLFCDFKNISLQIRFVPIIIILPKKQASLLLWKFVFLLLATVCVLPPLSEVVACNHVTFSFHR